MPGSTDSTDSKPCFYRASSPAGIEDFVSLQLAVWSAAKVTLDLGENPPQCGSSVISCRILVSPFCKHGGAAYPQSGCMPCSTCSLRQSDLHSRVVGWHIRMDTYRQQLSSAHHTAFDAMGTFMILSFWQWLRLYRGAEQSVSHAAMMHTVAWAQDIVKSIRSSKQVDPALAAAGGHMAVALGKFDAVPGDCNRVCN